MPAGLIALFCALAPGPAHAIAVPSVPDCTFPTHVVLVGRDANGAADPLGTLNFVIRAVGHRPISGAIIVLDFSSTPDLKISSNQPDGGILDVSCPVGSVKAMTHADGSASFSIVGRAIHSAAGAHAATLDLYCNGVLLGTIPVAAFDQDGVAGINPTDNSLFLNDFFSGQYWERSDFDGNGVLGPADLSLWAEAFFAANSVQSGMEICP
jgi:hypothetical protein